MAEEKEGKAAGRKALVPSDEVMEWVWAGIALACAAWFLVGAVRWRYPNAEVLCCMMVSLVLRRLAVVGAGGRR